MFIPDAYDAWESHEREQQQWLEKRPVCVKCKEHIQDERAYYINDDWICAECISSYEREVTED